MLIKKLKYFFRSFKGDFLTAIFAVSSTILALRFAENPKILFLYSIVITIITLVTFIYLRLREKDFYFIPMTNRKNKDDWFGHGLFEYERNEKCFTITDSDSGYIYSKALIWSDYKFSCEFKIVKQALGIVLRAINLSNYAMLQITPNGIRPHIRVNGNGWYIKECKDAELCFTDPRYFPLSLDKWYRCVFYCEKSTISIKLFEDKVEIFDRKWEIPQGQSVLFRFPTDKAEESILSMFPINLEYGSVGFRNDGTEKALVKDLLVEKI
jgi:hypothetical protein